VIPRQLETRSEAAAFSLAFLASLVLAYALANLLSSEEPRGFGHALRVVVLVWAGFIAATQSLTVLFEGRHAGLYLLNVGYQLVACGVVAVILIGWRSRAGTKA